ncbi:heavy metal translocating P-type ATPase [Salinactinospora qingdaonensis]|uniref:Heavy metal translocating P-type ATPase n=1 Tax=Salinactinospora qingdaonensis TaxID=702744 RepID=A0ABP7GIC2_9ACTN
MTPQSILAMLALGGLAAGALLHLAGLPGAGDAVWLATTVLCTGVAAWWVVEGLRRRQLGTDVIALLALVGTIAVQEFLAGAIIAVMLTGGRLLEDRASRRARRELGALLARAPRFAHRVDSGEIVTVPVEEVAAGDLLAVRTGEIVPVDGHVESGTAVLDESAVTGEPLPAERQPGELARSGVVNAGSPFHLRATTDATSSTYGAIVRLVREAEAKSAPFVRLADRYAAVFLPVTLLLAGGAWLLSGDPVRAVAVLVVATPCPLILAAPIAFTSGMSRCAGRGVIVKSGDAIERLARARVLLFDKTGTVTTGHPRLDRVLTATWTRSDEVLGWAASLDQASSHVLAAAIVRAARERDLPLHLPTGVSEVPGAGLEGMVEGRSVRLGKASWVAADPPAELVESARVEAGHSEAATVFVGVDGHLAGILLLRDPLRPDAPRTLRLLRRAGIERAVMVTGDRASVAAAIGDYVGADEVHAEQSPEGKVAVAEAASATAATVMVGDGVNDAPALARAGVGVALGARGATASSQTADIVITVDRLARLAETLAIAQRTRTIAGQSVGVGMGLSLAAMVVAALGYLPPVAGAVLQEAIDVAVILNALRTLFPRGPERAPVLRGDDAELVHRLDEEHRRLWPHVDELARTAETLRGAPEDRLAPTLTELSTFLAELAEHEREDERVLYPAVDRALGTPEVTATMSRAHAEISALIRRSESLVAELRAGEAGVETRERAAQALIELHALLRLHFAQEEENFHVLAPQVQE